MCDKRLPLHFKMNVLINVISVSIYVQGDNSNYTLGQPYAFITNFTKVQINCSSDFDFIRMNNHNTLLSCDGKLLAAGLSNYCELSETPQILLAIQPFSY